MTYAAVPSVLQNGVVVYQNVKNACELERILAAAPVTVGTSAEKMYTAVMLQRDPQNVAYFLEPEEITSIKRMDTPSPTGGRPAPNIVFRDNVSIPDTTVPRGTVNVNTQDMRSGAEYARLPRLVETGWQGRGTQYSIRNTRPMPWQDRITSCYDGSLKSSDSLYLGTTGMEIGTRLGIADAPLYLPTSVVTKAERGSSGSRSAHSMDRGDILALDNELRDSAAVVYNPARGALIYLTKGTASGKPLLIAVQNDVELDGERVNRIKSAYGLDNPQAWIANQIAAGKKLRIYDNEKADSFLNGFGYLAERTEDYRLGDTIPEIRGNVNTENGGFVPLELPRLVDANGMATRCRRR